MANMEDSNDESDFILVQRKNTMKRGKPLPQLYRPGSGPLKKSNTLEESESDTNISITSRNNQIKKASVDNSRFKSEGCTPRERSTYVAEEVNSYSEAMSNSDTTRRQKKPEKEIYVPRPVAQAREVVSSQNSINDSFHHSNGNGFNERSISNAATSSDQQRNYPDRRNDIGIDNGRHEWREQTAPRNRHKQGIEQRGPNDGWSRPRDPRSLEPSAPSGRPSNERAPPKPPTGRRHSAAGVEADGSRRGGGRPAGIYNLPPRLQRKYLAEGRGRVAAAAAFDDDWDGASVTFQPHQPPRAASFHAVGGGGYNTLPSRPRGRGRLNAEYETMPGHIYGCITPDAGHSPASSRPASPHRRPDSRPHTPVNQPDVRGMRSEFYGGKPDSRPHTPVNQQDVRGMRNDFYGGKPDSRPHTPVNQPDVRGMRSEFYGGKPDSRPQTPVNVNMEHQDKKGPIGKSGNQDRRGDSRRRDQGNRRYNDYDFNNKDSRRENNWETESHDSYNTRKRDRDIGNRTEDLGSMDRDLRNWDRDVGNKNRDMGNWDKDVGDKNRDTGNRNRDVADKNRDMGNRDRDVGDKNRDTGNRNRDVGDKNRDMGNWDRDVGDKNRDTGNRNRDVADKNRDMGNRDRDVGDKNRDTGNRNRDVGDKNREMRNWDRDLGDKNRDTGNRNRDVGDKNRDMGNWDRDVGDKNRDAGNRNRDFGNRNRDIGNRNRDVGNRNKDVGNWDRDRDPDSTNRDLGKGDRDNDNRREQATPGRRGRGSFREKRRDSRRDKDRRGGGRNFVESQENENWDEEVIETQNSEFKASAERQLSPVLSEEKFEATIQIDTKILDWSEEVELNDKLEAEYHSDAMTRSSSVVSLQDISTKSLPPNTNNTPSSRKNKRRNRRRSRNGNDARENTRDQRSRQNSTTSVDSRDGFKAPYDSFSRKKSRDRRENSFDRFHNSSRNISRDSSWDRQPASGNWRDEMVKRSAENEEKVKNLEEIKNVDSATKKAGVLVLPQQKPTTAPPKLSAEDHPRYPDSRKSPGQQKLLFDPNNPSKPILIKASSSRVSAPGFSDHADATAPQLYTTDQFGNLLPKWYDENSREFRSCHYPDLIRDVKRADCDLQVIVKSGLLLVNWDMVDKLRQFLKEALQYLICKAIKFCELGNIEQHFWKILYHNIIEVTRKAFKDDPENKAKYKGFLLYLIDEGTKYFEGLLPILEETYNFKLNNFLKENNMASHKDLKLVGLALVSAQKICLCLGDLGRYKEEVNETSNYGMCRQWYIKSHEINPKNGRPYNQLAILAVYARRKLDAVYYYMRSLMSTNPVPSARENLTSLFDENRKKYEQGERRRREERLERRRSQMRRKESEQPGGGGQEDGGGGRPALRKETWVHPEGGRRVHRTTSSRPEGRDDDSDGEELAALTSVEVNKRFVISYLHVHGKLITNIGMESFQETAMQMLKEFRALLQHSPVPLPCNRFLQLLALNMFAIDSTQLKDPQLQSQAGYRSELQERALVVSLQMFDLILERCVVVLREHLESPREGAPLSPLPPDADVLLPPIKVWCDWMLCHTDVWNPPPSTRDFHIGGPGDAWSRLATLMNLLEKVELPAAASFVKDPREGYVPVRLSEDGALSGFTPLAYSASAEPWFAPASLDGELAAGACRVARLLFFGTVYLCGVEPPVLRLEIERGRREYVSAVGGGGGRSPPGSPPATPKADVPAEQDDDVLLESFSEDENDEQKEKITANASNEIRDLLTRKVELEKRQRSQDLHMQRVKKILSQSVVSVHMEIRPKYLVPDTNCFIDHLDGIATIAQSNCYTLMVPTIVLSELEGLSRGGRPAAPFCRPDVRHAGRVAAAARAALEFLRVRHPAVKCVTTRGAVLPSAAFSTEEDGDAAVGTPQTGAAAGPASNDDKILGTCLVLCRGRNDHQMDDIPEGEPRRLIREVVLLTDDRNLRVKAHARDLPVRELPDFAAWAALG